MATVVANMSMSLDGFTFRTSAASAGRLQEALENPAIVQGDGVTHLSDPVRRPA